MLHKGGTIMIKAIGNNEIEIITDGTKLAAEILSKKNRKVLKDQLSYSMITHEYKLIESKSLGTI